MAGGVAREKVPGQLPNVPGCDITLMSRPSLRGGLSPSGSETRLNQTLNEVSIF